MTPPALLPSWRPGRTRDAVVAFLAAAEALPVEARVAAFDNDGTLWCEKPTYVQFDFFEDALRRRAEADPALRERPELAAVLNLDMAAIGELGLERVALALVDLFAGIEPEVFTAAVRDFMARARHRTLGVPAPATRYQPMLELLDELRRRDFTIYLVSGGGTEFLRAVSAELYGVPPEARGGYAGSLRVHPPARRAARAPANRWGDRRRQRGRGEGDQHPVPARATADPGGRQLGR